MLDVHPPHHPTHTWPDFFIHIATITVGLLIAVGLEQTVEAIHHHHQRRHLEEQVRAEAEHNLAIVEINLARLHEQRDFIDSYITALNTAPVTAGRIDMNALPKPGPQVFAVGLFEPSRSAWTVAKSSGTVSLLPEDEARVFARLDHEADVIVQDTLLPTAKRDFGVLKRTRLGLPPAQAAFLPVEQREAYLHAYASLSYALRIAILLQLNESGACRAVLRGTRSEDEVFQSMLEEVKLAPQF